MELMKPEGRYTDMINSGQLLKSPQLQFSAPTPASLASIFGTGRGSNAGAAGEGGARSGGTDWLRAALPRSGAVAL